MIGVGLIGCSPSELAQYSPDGVTCVDRINSAIRIFNSRVATLVQDLNDNLDSAKFTYINGYHIVEDILQQASSYGNDLNDPCPYFWF